MSRIDQINELGDKILNHWALSDTKQLGLEACTIALELAVQVDRLTTELSQYRQMDADPMPLTLEELRGMDGEPVWIESEEWKISGEWGIVRNVKLTGRQKLYVHFHAHGKNGHAMNVSEQDYGTWLAYAHKPKDGKGEG